MNNFLSSLKVTPTSYKKNNNITQFKITHDYFTRWTIYILHQGEIRYAFKGGGEHVLKAGQFLICPPFYNLNKIATSPVSFSILKFDGGKEKNPNTWGELVYNVNERMEEDIRLLEKCSPQDALSSHLKMDIWYQICMLYSDPLIPFKVTEKPDAFTSLLFFINDSLNKKLTLDDLSLRLCCSKSALIRAFRENVGCTPMQYITEKRISYAKRCLADVSLSIKEIAVKAGFANEFYFSSVFKKETGFSPSQFRKTNII